MIVVRTVLHGKFGSGGTLAAARVENMKAMAKAAPNGVHSWRVLTDRSGLFDRVTIEIVVDSMAVWESARETLFADPELAKSMQRTGDVIEGGSQEFLHIEAEGLIG